MVGAVTVAGVDGCRAGWVVVETPVRVPRPGPARVESRLAPLLGRLADPADPLALVAVDMPIGLAEDGPRPCDAAARALLGPRRASVFPAPPRVVLGLGDHPTASAAARAATGSGIPLQTWHLVPRIEELDRAIAALPRRARDRVVETHPELAFAVLLGAPATHPKRTRAGRRERLGALRPFAPGRRTAPAAVPRGAAPDDVLDALALAVRAAQWLGDGPAPVEVGGDRDRVGLPMRIRG